MDQYSQDIWQNQQQHPPNPYFDEADENLENYNPGPYPIQLTPSPQLPPFATFRPPPGHHPLSGATANTHYYSGEPLPTSIGANPERLIAGSTPPTLPINTNTHRRLQDYPPYPLSFTPYYAAINSSPSPLPYPPETPSPPNVLQTANNSTVTFLPPSSQSQYSYHSPAPAPSSNALADELEHCRTTVRDLQCQIASQGKDLEMAEEEIAGLKAGLAKALEEKQAAVTELNIKMVECEGLLAETNLTNLNIQDIVEEWGQAKMILQMQNMTIDAARKQYDDRSEREIELEKQLEAVTQELKESTDQISQLKNGAGTGRTPLGSEALPTGDIRSQEGAEQLPVGESAVIKEWKRQKSTGSLSMNKGMNIFMEQYIGLETAKWFFLKTKAKIETMIRQGVDLQQEPFDLLVTGNPGTLTETVARIYGMFLLEYNACFPGKAHWTAHASECFADKSTGTDVIKNEIDQVVAEGGGIVEILDIHVLVEATEAATTGTKVLDYILIEMDKEADHRRFAFVLSGNTPVLEGHPTLASRFPNRIHLEDFTDEEILLWLESMVEQKYNGKMKIEGGGRGQYMQVIARRIGQARSSRCGTFQNLKAIERAFSRIRERQGERLERERRQGRNPSDFWLTKEDLIGPNPSDVKKHCPAWDELNSMIGLRAVKESLQSMIELIETNYRRELQGKAPTMQVTLNRVFLGPPGTGKTTVARLYGQILAHFGFLSSSEVVIKSAADFVGEFLGQSEVKTKAILAATVGKVLIIDEAYLLHPPRAHGSAVDIFKIAIIDTLVAEVQSTPGEDRCVLLLGYDEEMRKMFQETNPGLARRFDFDNAFIFEHYSESELQQILDLKLMKQGLHATPTAKKVVSEVLGRARVRPNFGNGGEVENVIGQAKLRYQARISKLSPSQRPDEVLFLPEDFDPEFSRGATATLNCRKLFEDMIGCDEIVRKLEGYQRIAHNAKMTGCPLHELIPTNFLFKGPPGTGKTMVARKMGKIYYDIGFLATHKVIECSSSDLISAYSNATGVTCQKMFEGALGHVLFIDEAYRLSDGGGRDALNEIVDMLTKPKYFGKLVVILAGYDDDMNRLLAVNAGLSSRFADEMIFRSMTPAHCVDLLAREIESKRVNAQILRNTFSDFYSRLCDMLAELSSLPLWGNARDIIALAKSMIGNVYNVEHVGPSGPVLAPDQALGAVWQLLTERRARVGGK